MESTDEPLINSTKEILKSFGPVFCHLFDFPNDGIDCSVKDPNKCVQCLYSGKYFSGESVDSSHYSVNFILYCFIWIITILVGVFGALCNVLIILVLKQRKGQYSLDILLIVLAGIDIFCCCVSIFASTGLVVYFGNWLGRNEFSVYFGWMASSFILLARSVSTLMTVLITIERYLMITCPVRSKSWFTPGKTKIMIAAVLFFACLLNYPRFVGFSVKPNDLADIPSLQSSNYLLRETEQGRFWYITLNGVMDKIDFWMPLPIILVFNLLSFWKVHQFSKRRQEMNLTQKQNIRATRMFLPVVLVYFLTNIEPFVNYVIIQFNKIVYRELVMLLFLSSAVNSAVNLVIYYYRSVAFRKETRILLAQFLKKSGLAERQMSQSYNKLNVMIDAMESTEEKMSDGVLAITPETSTLDLHKMQIIKSAKDVPPVKENTLRPYFMQYNAN